MIIGIILNIALISVEQRAFIISAELTGSTYLLAILFIANIVIARIGNSFNGKIDYYEQKQTRSLNSATNSEKSTYSAGRVNATNNYWKCRYCGRLNNTNVFSVRNAEKIDNHYCNEELLHVYVSIARQ